MYSSVKFNIAPILIFLLIKVSFWYFYWLFKSRRYYNAPWEESQFSIFIAHINSLTLKFTFWIHIRAKLFRLSSNFDNIIFLFFVAETLSRKNVIFCAGLTIFSSSPCTISASVMTFLWNILIIEIIMVTSHFTLIIITTSTTNYTSINLKFIRLLNDIPTSRIIEIESGLILSNI